MKPRENSAVVEAMLPKKGDSKQINCLREWSKKNLLFIVTICGVLLGICFGFALRPLSLHNDIILVISYPGELFMRLLKMMILPLVISSLLTGCAKLNGHKNGKIVLRTLTYFFVTSVFHAILGIALVTAIHPGRIQSSSEDFIQHKIVSQDIGVLDGILDLGRNIIPDNLFQATFQQTHTVLIPIMTNKSEAGNITSVYEMNNTATYVRSLQYRNGMNTIGIIFFCLMFGTVLGIMGKRAQVVVEFFTVVDEAVMRIMSGVMWFTPLGVLSIISGKILWAENLAVIVQQLAWFITTIISGILISQVIILQLIYFVFTRRNPVKFYWNLVPAILTAFATASTAAALPISFRCMDKRGMVDPRISRFILPIGSAINMDGTALFAAVATIFLAQINQIELSFGDLITVCLLATAASFSSASIPSAAIVLLFMILDTVNVPSKDISLLLTVDWLVDRIRTTSNMLGDCYCAAAVQQLSKKELFENDAEKQEGDVTDVNTESKGQTQSQGSTVIEMAPHMKNGNAIVPL